MKTDFSRKLLMLDMSDLDEEAFQPHCGRMRLYGGKGKGGSAPAPDPAVGQAALDNIKLGKDWLSFAREQFAEGNERQAVTDALNTKVVNQQLAAQDETTRIAREDRDRTEKVFQPVEDDFVKTAKEFDTPEKQAEAAAIAKADVLGNATVQQQGLQRQMASMGIRPDSGRFAGITRAQDTNTALASAGAQNNARNMIRDRGIALKSDAVNIGKGLPSSTIAAYGMGNNSGNSAVGNNASANAQFIQNGQVMGQGFQGAMSGNSSGGGMLSNLYGKQLDAWSAQKQANATSSAGIGTMIGTIGAAALMSCDIRVKQDITQIGRMRNGLPVYIFAYKPEYRDECGHGYFMGVMAQEVEEIFPDAVVTRDDGRKLVNYGALQ